MNKKIFFFVSIFFFFLLSSDAAIYKGQKYFVKRCIVCHTERQVFILEKTIKEWESFLSKNGEALADIHFKDKLSQKSWDYFESKKYIKESKHLKQFLMEYAKDSGNVPACN